jgi:hypothetical protein
VVVEERSVLPTVTELLAPAYLAGNDGDGQFFRALHEAIWKFFTGRFELSGSEMSKVIVNEKMNAAGVPVATKEQLLEILSKCEAGMFTSVNLEEDKAALLQQAKEILESIAQVTG